MHKDRICTICVRAGSKSVKHKNIRNLGGKPLLTWTVEQAVASQQFDVVAVSSDSDEYLDLAGRAGAGMLVRRPDALATDEIGKVPVIRHLVDHAEQEVGRGFKLVVDLQVTSPFRAPFDIAAAISLLESNPSAENVVSATPCRHSPYFTIVERDSEGYLRIAKSIDGPIVRRQDAPACFDLNGSIYVWKRAALDEYDSACTERSLIYEMPAHRSIDIDDELDLLVAEMLAQRIDPSTGALINESQE